MARTTKLAPTEPSTPKGTQVVAPSRFGGLRSNLPTILGAVALVAAGALAGTAFARGGFDGRDGRHPGGGLEARMDMDGHHMDGDHMDGGKGPDGDRDGDGPQGAGDRQGGPEFAGTVVSASSTELTITLADGTTQAITLDGASQLFAQTSGSAADVTVGSYVLVDAGMPIGTAPADAIGIAVLDGGLTDAHVHLGRPAKVTAVNGSEISLEAVTPRGTESYSVTIGAATKISIVSAATTADLAAGASVLVDFGPHATAAKSVLIVK